MVFCSWHYFFTMFLTAHIEFKEKEESEEKKEKEKPFSCESTQVWQVWDSCWKWHVCKTARVLSVANGSQKNKSRNFTQIWDQEDVWDIYGGLQYSNTST